jgi:hypothetical protein
MSTSRNRTGKSPGSPGSIARTSRTLYAVPGHRTVS